MSCHIELFSQGCSGSRGPLVGSGFHHGLGRDSREVTLQQGGRGTAGREWHNGMCRDISIVSFSSKKEIGPFG